MRHILSLHLTFGYFVMYTSIYRLTERKKRFHLHNCPCGTVGAKIGNVVGILVHGNVLANLVGKYSSLIVYYEKH